MKIMRQTGMLKIAIIVTAVLLSCGTAEARYRHRHIRSYRAVTVVARPDVTVHTDNRFTQRERLRMAMAYMENHCYLTVRRYAKMTGLPKAVAKAELDAFAADRETPIEAVKKGKRTVFVLSD